ncbi:Tannase/feruloyl esterase, partial [Clohesyomyces aquaticus]
PNLNYCDVKVRLNHPGAADDVLVEVVLPLSRDGWNGRFQAQGGGGFATGLFDLMFGKALQTGYAAASTDGGHDGLKNMVDLSWALKDDYSKTINWPLLQNFATRSLPDLVHVGKSITAQYYGEKPHHSYWNGCSQGGRQGLVMAQKYPGMLDGILAEAPAASLTHLLMAGFWPQIVMKEKGLWLSNCELDYFGQKAMEVCDIRDGFRDNVINDPEECVFDERELVEDKIECDGTEVEITYEMARVVRMIRQGPNTLVAGTIWHGVPQGVDYKPWANISISAEGRRGSPWGIAASFIKNLLLKDPSFSLSSLNRTEYLELWTQASVEYGWILDGDNPDLSAFRAVGGKLLSWHGMSDQIIPYANAIQYRNRVEMEMGGPKATNEFYRLFLAPGVKHCMGGSGPVPTDPLAQLVDWVEKGEAPETLEASMMNEEYDLVTRDVCLYPKKAKYMGVSDPKRASSWSC